ncbi:MAG: hypothetical protein ACLFMP_00550 [Desulfonatronovibrionaceae bacterium]
MNYNRVNKAVYPLLDDRREYLQDAGQALKESAPKTFTDEKILLVLKNILKNIEIGEHLKEVARGIADNHEYFSSPHVTDEEKEKTLKKILEQNKYVKNSRLFNISIIQTYIETILNDKLHEINIKVEENQRFLHRMLYSSGGPAAGTEVDAEDSQFMFVEIGDEQYALPYRYSSEILKTGKKATRLVAVPEVAYKKVLGPFKKNLFKKINSQTIRKNIQLKNLNPTLALASQPAFAIVLVREGNYYILFADNILNLEPVEAQNLGDYVETLDGVYPKVGL